MYQQGQGCLGRRKFENQIYPQNSLAVRNFACSNACDNSLICCQSLRSSSSTAICITDWYVFSTTITCALSLTQFLIICLSNFACIADDPAREIRPAAVLTVQMRAISAAPPCSSRSLATKVEIQVIPLCSLERWPVVLMKRRIRLRICCPLWSSSILENNSTANPIH